MLASHKATRSPAYIAILGAAICCYAALGEVLSILPRYVPDRLGGGATAVGLSVGAPALTALLFRPLGGRLADRVGPRIPLVTGAVVMTLGTVPAAASTRLVPLLASRLLVGAGEGVMMSATVLWLLRMAGPEQRGRALGHIGLANYCGLAAGPVIAALLGGAHAAGTVLWTSLVPPILGAAVAATVRSGGGGRVAGSSHTSTLWLLRRTATAGAGLALVNVGYVAVLSFGGAVSRAHGTGIQGLIVPGFAVIVVTARTLGGGIPDRIGGRRTVITFAGLEAVGLLGVALGRATVPASAALLVLSLGQSLAVPGLGLLALAGVEAPAQGAAAGLFFAWFDAGVGFGGPAVGAAAALSGPTGALILAAGAVGLAAAGAAIGGARRRPAPA